MFIDAQPRNAHCEANHNGNHNMVKLQAETKQNQSKRNLKNTTLELPINSQSIYKLHGWNTGVYQMACGRLGTKPHHTFVKHITFHNFTDIMINNIDRETAAHTLVSMASRHRTSATTTRN